MSSQTLNRITQVILAGIWISLLVLNISPPVSSQSCPNPRYSDEIFIWRGSWVPGSQVSVQIDSAFSEDQSSGLEFGNLAWNNPSLLTCSGVSFLHFDREIMQDYEEAPPLGHLWWQRDDPLNGKNGIVLAVIGFGGFVEAARIKILPGAPNIAQGTYYNYLGSHEVGHTFNLRDCVSGSGCLTWTDATIMTGHADGITSPASFNITGPKACDISKVRDIYCPAPSPTPTPTPEWWPWPWPEIPTQPEPCKSGGWYWNHITNSCNPEPLSAQCPGHCVPYNPLDSGGCYDASDYCQFPYGCPPGTVDGGMGCCCFPTPIIIDINGDGFALTDKDHGVHFDMGGDGHSEPISWAATNSDDAWLVLDRNGNNLIDNSREMFGMFTEQPHATTARNGFVALAEFDRGDAGGNRDGQIDSRDAVFSNLKLWQDHNHDGISQADELSSLTSLGIAVIELDFKESKHTDDFGNEFRYRAKVKDIRGAQVGRWAYDVFLTTP